MSNIESARSSTPDKDEYAPVYIPEAFKKTRAEKMKDQNKVLSRLQGLMSDIRHKENQI